MPRERRITSQGHRVTKRQDEIQVPLTSNPHLDHHKGEVLKGALTWSPNLCIKFSNVVSEKNHCIRCVQYSAIISAAAIFDSRTYLTLLDLFSHPCLLGHRYATVQTPGNLVTSSTSPCKTEMT